MPFCCCATVSTAPLSYKDLKIMELQNTVLADSCKFYQSQWFNQFIFSFITGSVFWAQRYYFCQRLSWYAKGDCLVSLVGNYQKAKFDWTPYCLSFHL